MKEMQSEVQSEKIFGSTLDCIATNDNLYKLAVAGENCIKVYNLSTWKELKNEKIVLPKNIGKVSKMEWSQNGQLLVASTSNGHLIGYTTSIPFVFAEHLQLAAVLTSFTEVQIYNLDVL